MIMYDSCSSEKQRLGQSKWELGELYDLMEIECTVQLNCRVT